MADGPQRQSVFLAPTFQPQEAEGPFTEMLMQPLRGQPATPVAPGGAISPYAAAAAIAEKFFEGASQGRIRKFALEENAKSQKLNSLNSYMQAIWSNPDVTDEAKQAAAQRYFQAIGATGQEALAGGRGKGKGKGRQPEGPLGHIGNALGNVFQALSGGQMPEGAADVGSTMADIQGMLFAQGKLKPEYSRMNLGDKILAEAMAAGKEAGLKPGETSAEKAAAVYGPSFQKMQIVDPVRAQSMRQDLLSPYQPAPPPGSPQARSLAATKELERLGAAPPATMVPTPGGIIALPPTAQAYGQWLKARSNQWSTIDPQNYRAGSIEPVEFMVNGERFRRPGIELQNPDYTGYVDPQSFVPMPSGAIPVSKAGAQGLRTVDVTWDEKGRPFPDGKPHKVLIDESQGGKYVHDYGPSPVAGSVAAQNEQLAFDAYKQKHKIAGDLSPIQRVAALREMKEATEPTDIATTRALNQLAIQERINAVREGKADSQVIAESIMDGTQPPDLTRLYGRASAVRAELARQGYDLRNAQLDWQGTQRWMSTLNSATQVRLRQATNFAYESLDLVDQLSDELSKKVPRTQFPIFNRAALIAAKQGVFGQDAQTAANNLEIQIRDLQAELAQVYKGGTSPTDQGIKQAMGMLNSDWSKETLHQAIELSRKNLRIRLNSISNTGPVTGMAGGAEYDYDPQTKTVTPRKSGNQAVPPPAARQGGPLSRNPY